MVNSNLVNYMHAKMVESFFMYLEEYMITNNETVTYDQLNQSIILVSNTLTSSIECYKKPRKKQCYLECSTTESSIILLGSYVV